LQTGKILNSETYTSLLANPQKIGEDDLLLLDTVVEKYPYFQSARALQLKGLKNNHSFLYNDALKVTAAYTTERDILFDYITSETFIQNEISQAILKHDASLNEIEVVSENISESVSLELDKQIKNELKKAEAILDPSLFERKVSAVSEILGHTEEVSETIIEDPKLESAPEVSMPNTLQINEPLEFRKEDTHSFSEWLQLTKTKPIDRSSEKEKKEETLESEVQNEKDRKFDLIEKFIQEKPRLAPKENPSSTAENKNLAAAYTQAPSGLMTETLAKVYLQQKNYKKAIQAYKILILKYPEKSGFFADQIRAVEKLINTENK